MLQSGQSGVVLCGSRSMEGAGDKLCCRGCVDVAGIYDPKSRYYIFEEQRISAFQISSKFPSKNEASCESVQEFQTRNISYKENRFLSRLTSRRKRVLDSYKFAKVHCHL